MSVVAVSLLLISTFSLLHFARCTESEVKSLLEFKKGFKSDPSNRIFNSWVVPSNLSACPDSFYGVVCDPSTSASVVSIALDRMGLVGDLKFTTLTNLRSLQNLTLSGNSLTGRLVPAIGSMSTLEVIDLSGNQFYGPIPDKFNYLWALNHVNLSNNKFSGWFPSGIRNLQQLRVLDLSGNELEGDIAEFISELRNVEHLDLSGNAFSGSIDLGVENVSTLANTVQYVNLSRNHLGGDFWRSDVISLFRNLKVLDLNGNGIAGELPDFDGLPNLQVLRLGSNQISGTVPEKLVQGGVPLVELDLSGNEFSGPIPTINSTTLSLLNISSNLIMGSLPESVGNSRIVDLSGNILSGDLTVLESWNENLEFLDLGSNALTGTIPDLMRFQELTMLGLRNNSIEGILPSTLGSYPKMNAIDLSSNRFEGQIPSSLFMSMTITNLNLSGNHLTGTIPLESSRASELLVLTSMPPMEYLDLSNNALSGGLASDIGNWGRLKLLNFSKNNLSGPIPDELSKLTFLEYLDLSHNDFDGEIPAGLSSNLKFINLAYNNLSGKIPQNLNHFPRSSFFPGNDGLQGHHSSPGDQVPDTIRNRHSSKSSIRIAIIVACVGAVVLIAFVLLAYRRARFDFHVRRGGEAGGGDLKAGIFGRTSLFNFPGTAEPTQTSLSFSNDHLLTSNSRSISGPIESSSEIVEEGVPHGSVSINPVKQDNQATTSGRKSSPGSPVSSSPRFIDTIEQPVTLDVNSPDRLAGELLFLDASLTFTAEELSRAPAEVLGRSSHGTLYKATLDNGHTLTVKWLRVGLVRNKKEFAKEVKKIGSIKHQNIVPVRAYYWGPREQERLLLADYVHGDSLALHLYETTPRRYSPLSFNQRLKLAIDVAQSLQFLHDRGLPHGNLKPTNIILAGPEYSVRLTDYSLYKLMTPSGIAEQILNLGALGYRAPELATSAKPAPSFKADVYAFGVILMELLTRRSAGDIISGQSGAVDLTDWVRLCDQQGRGMDCIDRDIAGGEEHSKAMEDTLAVSLRCILPVNERPSVKQVLDDLCSISV